MIKIKPLVRILFFLLNVQKVDSQNQKPLASIKTTIYSKIHPENLCFRGVFSRISFSSYKDGYHIRNSYAITPAQHLCLLLFIEQISVIILNSLYLFGNFGAF